MRTTIAAALLAFAAAGLAPAPAFAEPAKKEQLMAAPTGARHYTITSSGGKHGDIWQWTLPDGRVAYRMSMNLRGWIKMVGLVARLHKAGAPIVAGTDGWGLELVRELELYQQIGMTNAQAVQSATIVPARMTGMDKEFGSVTPGKTANLILVDGDVSQDLTRLRQVETVFLDGYRHDADALREASGLSGRPD